jgi:hypothetical protein
MIGTFDSCTAWSTTSSEAWLTSTTMPSRLASASQRRPSGEKPCQIGLSVELSANWLFLKCTGPAMRTPVA